MSTVLVRRAAERQRTRRRGRWVAVTLVVVVLGLGVSAWFTPLLSVRQYTVRGISTVTESEVLTALDVPTGTRLLPLDTGAAAARVAALRPVATARVSRTWPDGLAVTVTERVAAAWVAQPDGPHLLDATGVDFATRVPPVGLPKLVVADAVGDSPAARAALTALGALPAQLRAQVVSVTAATPDAVTANLTEDRVVVWGSAEASARKAAVLAALVTQPGSTFDVSSPDLPTVS